MAQPGSLRFSSLWLGVALESADWNYKMCLMKLCLCIRLLHVASAVAMPLSNIILPVCIPLGLGRGLNSICPIQSKSLFLASKPSLLGICEIH